MKIELIDREEFDRRTKYWIHFDITECPICGRGDKFRTRVLYSERDKPDNPYVFSQHYDYCDVL